MNWYIKAVNSNAWEIPPAEWGISASQAEDMLNRTWNIYKKYYMQEEKYRTQEQWKKNADPHTMAIEIESDWEIYNRFLSQLPDEIGVEDVIEAWRANMLPVHTPQPLRLDPINITDAPELDNTKFLGAPQKRQELPIEELQEAWDVAKTKITDNNRQEVLKARNTILIQNNINPQTADQLGLTSSELNKQIYSWSRFTAEAQKIQAQANQDTNITVAWDGMLNSSYLAETEVSPEEIDTFFGEITVKNKDWLSPDGEALRKYILRTALAIDTRIDYSNLNFEIDSSIKPLGEYNWRTQRIYIRANSPHTIAHEIGHYLDHKWASDLGLNSGQALSEMDILQSNTDNDYLNYWYKLYQEFVMQISASGKSNISSTYTQKRSEVFARFIAQFVDWVNTNSGRRTWGEFSYNDNFSEADFMKFIKLLQMKAYADSFLQGDNNG